MNIIIYIIRNIYLSISRNLFRFIYRKSIKRNKNKRILVVLHLFYMEQWDEIKLYLKNLKVYNFELYVTYIKDNFNQKILDDIKNFHRNTVFFVYENKGFDIGPFVDVLQKINLSEYDIVFKLHSKGIKRKYIYIYNQIFKYKDWFRNLYNGILGCASVHKTINAFNNKKIGLVAAENLIIQDPKHKQWFTCNIANALKIKIKPHYKFVAGSCFAIKASCLNQIQKLKLNINNFEKTTRGVFSLAHAMERIVCAIVQSENLEEYGITTKHKKYSREVKEENKTSAIRLLDDRRFCLDYEFFYHDLEMLKILDYKIIKIALKDIYRNWEGNNVSICETHPYLYLKGNVDQYKEYCNVNNINKPYNMSVNRFEGLIENIEKNGFNNKYMPVINGNDFTVWDGQHRLCILYNKYGGNFKVKVLAIYL